MLTIFCNMYTTTTMFIYVAGTSPWHYAQRLAAIAFGTYTIRPACRAFETIMLSEIIIPAANPVFHPPVLHVSAANSYIIIRGNYVLAYWVGGGQDSRPAHDSIHYGC